MTTGAGPTGTIFNVQRFSTHDGPGIRTTVFFKGCPMRCVWCHNPEGIAPRPEMVRIESRCIECGQCHVACEVGASVDRAACRACGRCADGCPTGARQLVGRRVGAAELVAAVMRDAPFYDESGGGVTFSGGEPLMQPEFLADVLGRCRRAGVHTAVDTCGAAPDAVAEELARCADLFLFDLKHTDPRRHLELTGVPLEVVLTTLATLSGQGARIWLRLPLVPPLNDQPDHLAEVARIAAATRGVERISVLPFHANAAAKHARLASMDRQAGIVPPSADQITAVTAQLGRAGLPVAVGG